MLFRSVDALGRVTAPAVKVRAAGTRLTFDWLSPTLGVPGVIGSMPSGMMLAPFTNPSGRRVALSGIWARAGHAEVALFDITGRRVRTLFAGPAVAGAWRADADLAGLAPGVYLVRAGQDGGAQLRRLVLLR